MSLPMHCDFFKFTAPADENSLIICPECGETTKLVEWIDGERDCESCGGHFGLGCPRCEDFLDSVFTSKIEVMPMQLPPHYSAIKFSDTVNEKSLIVCPVCKKSANILKWNCFNLTCELKGFLIVFGMQCPNCEVICNKDSVRFEVLQPE